MTTEPGLPTLPAVRGRTPVHELRHSETRAVVTLMACAAMFTGMPGRLGAQQCGCTGNSRSALKSSARSRRSSKRCHTGSRGVPAVSPRMHVKPRICGGVRDDHVRNNENARCSNPGSHSSVQTRRTSGYPSTDRGLATRAQPTTACPPAQRPAAERGHAERRPARKRRY